MRASLVGLLAVVFLLFVPFIVGEVFLVATRDEDSFGGTWMLGLGILLATVSAIVFTFLLGSFLVHVAGV